MNDLIVKKFKNEDFYNFVWNNKPCWIGTDVAEIFGYSQKRKAIFDCIKREVLEEGIEYDILSGEDLKVFKEIFLEQLGDTKYAPKVIIFYEAGLYGFLNYTEMPLGIEFKNWIRRDVVPTLREKGYYIMEDVDVDIENLERSEIVHKDFEDRKFSTEKLEAYRMAFESAKIFEPLLNKITKDSTYKFLCLKKLFVDAGIEIPKFIEEELF